MSADNSSTKALERNKVWYPGHLTGGSHSEQGDVSDINLKLVALLPPGGLLNKVLYGEAPPGGSNPYPLIY